MSYTTFLKQTLNRKQSFYDAVFYVTINQTMLKTRMMKLLIASFLTAFVTFHIQAQSKIELPRTSPKASVSYTIGFTKVEVNYGAPAVKGRNIFGNIVPYDTIWRAGANENTTVSFSTDVNVEGQMLKAGTYSLFFIPGETEWTVIFNKQSDQWGAYKYDENEDAIRFEVEPKTNEGLQERLTYSIHDLKHDMGYIKMAWDKVRVFMRFKVEVDEQAMANVMTALENNPLEAHWIIYSQGAEYLHDHESNPSRALEWIKKATELRQHPWAWYLRSQIEAKAEDYVGAVSSVTRALAIGEADPNDQYFLGHKTEMETALQEWSLKIQ